MLFVYGGIAAGLSFGEPGSSSGLGRRQKSSRDLRFWAAEAFFSETAPLWLNRNERALVAAPVALAAASVRSNGHSESLSLIHI